MAALIKISTQEIIQTWGDNVPTFFSIPGVCDVHCPDANWTFGDYRLIPVVNQGTAPNEFWLSSGATQAISNNTLVITSTFVEQPLANVQTILCNRVDGAAEQIRLKYITPGAGQMGVYVIKYNEAKAVMADPAPIANNYPLNAASIGLPGITNVKDAANTVITQYEQWVSVASTIENTRLLTKSNINIANTVPSALAAYNAVNWGGL